MIQKEVRTTQRNRSRVAKVTAGGVLIRGDEILLGKRSAHRASFPGAWDVPGGNVKQGETLEQTLARELEEELGITPVDYRLLGVVREPRPEVYGEGTHHIYVVTKWNGVPRNLSQDEHSELAWVKLDEVDRLELAVRADAVLLRSTRDLTQNPSINP
jgi:mutator protein MutT